MEAITASDTSSLLTRLFQYKAWANDAFLTEFRAQSPAIPEADRHLAIRLVNHAYVVDRIFAAHLAGKAHAYTATNTPDTPALDALHRAIAESDRWYLDYVGGISPEQLSEEIAFDFTDGAKGRMSREEMLMHVALHAGYHRGQVGRILPQLTSAPPQDTFTTYLHKFEPDRRRRDDH